MVGYESLLVSVVIGKGGTVKNIILKEDVSNALSTIVIKKKMKDPAEEIIRNVIRYKNEIMAASGAYSCQIYVTNGRVIRFYFSIHGKRFKKPQVCRGLCRNRTCFEMAF